LGRRSDQLVLDLRRAFGNDRVLGRPHAGRTSTGSRLALIIVHGL